MKRLFLSLSLLLIICIFLNNKSEDQTSNQNESVIQSDALKALDFWSSQRAYPNESIPNANFFKAFEYSKYQLKKSKDILETDDTWQSIGPENRGGRTNALAVDPNDPNIIYAGSASGGLWRLTMDGNSYSWEFIDTGFPVLGVNSIVIDPTNSDVIYIGTGEVYGYQQSIGGLYIRTTRGSYGIGLLKTTDKGQTWTKSIDWSYNQQRGVLALEINPLNPNVIYAGTTEGLYKTTNAGQNWENILPATMIVDVAINPADTNIVFVTRGNLHKTQTGIYRSMNGGKNWTKLTMGLPSTWGGKALLDIYKTEPNIIYVSVGNGSSSSAGTWLCKSVDNGDNWAIVTTQNYSSYQGWFAHYVRVNPANSNRLMCAGVNFYLSTNGGTTLSQKSGMHVDHHCFANHPTDPNIVYLGNDGGVYRTLSDGGSFTALNQGYVTAQFYNGFASSALNPNLALGGLQDNGTIMYTGGQNWALGVRGGDGAFCGISSQNDDIMYASSQNLNLYLSTNQGNSWTNIASNFRGNAVFIAPYVLSQSQPWILYAGEEYIYKTENTGINWVKMNNGNPLNGNPILSIAVSPANPDVVYAATVPTSSERSEVFASTDGGFNWQNITGSLPDRYYVDLKVSPHNENVVYISLSGFGSSHLYRTEDGGLTWVDIDNGQLPDVPTSAVIIDPENYNHIYVGNDLGVYVSVDYGNNWQEFREDLPTAVLVMDLSISPSNQKIRAVTHGNGVYERSLIKPTSVTDQSPTVTSFQLFQNYPNPFNPETEIKFSIPEPGFVTLKIFNSLGKEIRTVVANGYPAGEFSTIWDGKDSFGNPVSAGTYFYKIKAGDFETSKIMTLMR